MIGNNVYIAKGSIVMGGITIGNNVTIGANAVVTLSLIHIFYHQITYTQLSESFSIIYALLLSLSSFLRQDITFSLTQKNLIKIHINQK